MVMACIVCNAFYTARLVPKIGLSLHLGITLDALLAHAHSISHAHAMSHACLVFLPCMQLPPGYSMWDMHLTGDILGDLPTISNFELSTEACYK